MSLVTVSKDSDKRLRLAVQKLASNLGVGSSPTFLGVTITTLSFEEVASLPNPAVEGDVVRLQTDNRLYFGLGS